MPATAAVASPTVLRSLAQMSRGAAVRTQRHISSASSSQPSFTYRIAVASSAKRTSPRTPKAGRDFWSYASTQEDAKPLYLRSTKQQAGEDAFFATTIGGSAHDVAFGVADGVGGWQDSGVDPSDFSHGLCGYMASTAYTDESVAEGRALRPQRLLQTAYDAVIANPRILAGGSTASLAVADGTGTMEAANLGDSGFLILGPDKVAHRSAMQTHAFNTPYQMAKIPARMRAQHAIFGGSSHFSETPADADVTRHALRHGDVVLFATDGVWDNLSAQDALHVVSRVMADRGVWRKKADDAETRLDRGALRALLPASLPFDAAAADDDEAYLPALLATAVMREAKLAGLDRRRDGPFAKEVKMRFPNEGWEGGKPDDIAVVVCVAVQDEVAAASTASSDDKPIKAKL